MSRLFYHVMQDSSGNILTDVSGTMRLAGTGTAATIYGDEALTVILPNPMTNHPSFGSFKCFLPPGDFDFYMAKSGYTFETLTGVQGLGTMAQEDASAPTITGVCTANRGFNAPQNALDGASAFYSTMAAGGTNRWALNCTGNAWNHLNGPLGLQRLPDGTSTLVVAHNKLAGQHGLVVQPVGGDTGALEVIFTNNVATPVGSISSTSSVTAFNTSSDVRLKHAIAPLTGALDVVRALNPITHRWRVDDSPGVGFLAHEVAKVVGGVVTGEKGAIDEQGQIVPQMMDYSKLVPWLVSACQDLAQQVQALTARLDAPGG